MKFSPVVAPSRASQIDGKASASTSQASTSPPPKGRFLVKICFNDHQQWLHIAERARFQSQNLAQQIGLSRRQIERYVKRHFGVTPQQWLRQLRMSRAVELMREMHSVKEVAFALGFSQVSSFCHQFKAYHGMTCSDYAAVMVAGGRVEHTSAPSTTRFKLRFEVAPAISPRCPC